MNAVPEGVLTYGGTTVRLRLAPTADAYRPIRAVEWPQRLDIPGGDEESQSAHPFIRRWSMSEWNAGETGALWRRDGYHRSSNVRPDRRGDDLILGANRSVAQIASAGGDFVNARVFGRAHGGLWAAKQGNGSAFKWTLADTVFPAAGFAIGGADTAVTSLTDFGDGLNLLVALADKSVRKVATGGNSPLFAAGGATYASELRRHQNTVYALDGASLYQLNTSPNIGNATFDYTGGASEDLWTLATHGLEVGDAVLFTVVGGGAPEYAINTQYWVVAVPSANTFRLSATEGGSVLEGTADSSGTWTIGSNARTVVSDPGTPVGTYMASAANIWRRSCVTDTGIAWLNPSDDGTIEIHEWNARISTDFQSGQLPVENVVPYSIGFAHGFLFVGFRNASAHDQDGPAHIYYQRGGQRGVTEEIRLPAGGSAASQPVIIAGSIGNLLVFYYGNAVWAYDLSQGSIFQLGVPNAAAPTGVTDAVVFGKDVFVGNLNTDFKAARMNTVAYSTDTATWDSGRFDFNYPGIRKALYTVSVVTDPLPANTAVTLLVSANGATFGAVSGTHDTTGATTFTWTVSTSTTQVTGQDFEIRLGLSSTASTSTPQIREVSVTAGPAQKRRGFELDLDASDGQVVKAASGTRLLSQLLAASEYTGGIVKFTDPWGVADYDAAVDREVMVEVLGGGRRDGMLTARLWEIGSI